MRAPLALRPALLFRVDRTPVVCRADAARHLSRLALALGVGVVAGPSEGGALAGGEEFRGFQLLRVVRAQRVGARALPVVLARVAGAVAHAPEVQRAAREDGLVGVAGTRYRDGEAVAVRRGVLVGRF